MKKYVFKGGLASHDASFLHRSLGSIDQKGAHGKVYMASFVCQAFEFVVF